MVSTANCLSFEPPWIWASTEDRDLHEGKLPFRVSSLAQLQLASLQTRSSNIATPWPTPTHIEDRA